MELKIAKTIPLNAVMLQDSQDLQFLEDYLGHKFVLEYGSITGAFVIVGSGDYEAIYVTFSNRPYLISSIYYEVH